MEKHRRDKMDYTNEVGSVNETETNVNKKAIKSYITGALIGCLAALIIVFGYKILFTGPVHFEKMFPDIVHNSWCTLSSDKKIMTIHIPGGDFEDYDAWKSVRDINEELDIAQGMKNDIRHEIDRMNSNWREYYNSYSSKRPESYYSDTYENKKYSVTWTYHRADGLYVVYVKK